MKNFFTKIKKGYDREFRRSLYTFKGFFLVGLFLIVTGSIFVLLNVGSVNALPSYARQTGLSCAACHYSFPELTQFGREFKLNGYTLTGMSTIDVKEDSDQTIRLKLLNTLPLSAMLQTSCTHIGKDIPGQQNNSVDFPQQLSLFYAGQITPHIGTFIQMTYNGQSIVMDNTDIRFSNQGMIGSTSIVYGLTLNNNPSVQDLWHTTPAWGFPYATSDAMPTPAKSTVIESLGQQVAGLGAYGMWNNLVYAEVSGYRSAQQGAANPADTTSVSAIKGVSPYWRLALQHGWGENYFEVGTFGIATQQFSSGISGLMDNITDVGFDMQVEHLAPFGALTLHSSFIHEMENRDTAMGQHISLNLNSFKVDGNVYLKKGLGGTIGYFTKTGSADMNVGSVNNLPNSSGYIFQLEYLPWLNTKFSIQYVLYNKFNGGVQNFDGMGRNASNNNAIYLLAWLNF